MASSLSPPLPTPSFLARHRIGLWRLVLFTFTGLCIVGTPAWPNHWLSTVLRLCGIALVSTAALGRMWCALYISGRKSQELVTAGPYSLCRHPLYLFNLVGFIGVAMLAESMVAAALLATAFAILYPSVIASEERILRSRFEEFDAYRASTPALLPRLSGYNTPLLWTVEVRAFVRNAADSVWFPLLGIAVEFLDIAHSNGWIRGLFPLY